MVGGVEERRTFHCLNWGRLGCLVLVISELSRVQSFFPPTFLDLKIKWPKSEEFFDFFGGKM